MTAYVRSGWELPEEGPDLFTVQMRNRVFTLRILSQSTGWLLGEKSIICFYPRDGTQVLSPSHLAYTLRHNYSDIADVGRELADLG